MALFSDEDDEFEQMEKMRRIEECCEQAKVVIQEACNENILYDLITKWHEAKIVSYEMTVLARHDMLKGEGDV